jgi:hypothetical protein
MYLYLSLTREQAAPRTWFTPVAAIHAGLSRGDSVGVKTYTGDSMWKDFHKDFTTLCGGDTARPARFVDPVGFDIQMTWATIMANLYKEGLVVYSKCAQPLNKKWQDKNTFELSRIFTQCAFHKDVEFNEEDAFKFMGMHDSYIDEDLRSTMLGDLFSVEEREEAFCKYMTALYKMHIRYESMFPGV